MSHKNKGFSKTSIVIIIVIVIGIIGYFVYSIQPQETNQLQEKVQSIEVQPPEKQTKKSIVDILAKAEIVGPVQYETVGSVATVGLPQEVTTTTITKVWQKIPYIRIDSTTKDRTTKMIIHPDAVYLYDASQDKYVKMTREAMAIEYTQKSFEELSKELRKTTTLKELGSETIDGKLTTIIEYSVNIKGTPIIQKLWIWNEKGVPLKAETISKIGGITYITKEEYKNFLFGDFPTSVFKVPGDKIIE